MQAARSDKKEEGKLLVLEVLELPTLSPVVNKILKIPGNKQSGISDMDRIISENKNLTRIILTIANSALFGLSQEVPTVSRAIVVLGFEAVRSIALGVSIAKAFGDEKTNSHFDWNRFWTHSLACAYLSKKIAGMTHQAQLETGFVCGLLHDVGKLVLDICFPDSYRGILHRMNTGAVSSVAAENEILGLTHAEVGMWLAQRWKLPKAVVFTIANHHGMLAEDPRYESLTAAIRLANHICLQEGVYLTDGGMTEPFEDSIINPLKLDPTALVDLQEALAERKESLISFSSSWS